MTEHTGRFAHETYVADNPPTTSQLFRLAAHAMSTARTTNKLRTMQTTPRAHFSVQEMCYYNDAANIVYDDYPAEIRHYMSIRIGRRAIGAIPIREWSLKFYDTRWYERPGDNWDGIRNRYSFEWTQNTVTLAERQFTYVPSTHQRELSDYLDHMPSLQDDTTDLIGAELEMSQITAADCEEIIADAARYYSRQEVLQKRRTA